MTRPRPAFGQFWGTDRLAFSNQLSITQGEARSTYEHLEPNGTAACAESKPNLKPL